MKLIDMFTDDKSKQFSLGRFLCFLIILANLTTAIALIPSSHAFMDVPVGWAGLATLLYGINKVVSNVTPSADPKPNVD